MKFALFGAIVGLIFCGSMLYFDPLGANAFFFPKKTPIEYYNVDYPTHSELNYNTGDNMKATITTLDT